MEYPVRVEVIIVHTAENIPFSLLRHPTVNCLPMFPEVMNKLKNKQTQLGATLLDIIQSGLQHKESLVGIYAADVESYTVFKELFAPIIQHYHFGILTKLRQAAKGCRHWPIGRGIFYNDAKTFLIWCNEGDHMRIISMQPGGDVGQVYQRLIKGLKAVEGRAALCRNDWVGWLACCPTNVGTTIRASVHIRIPKISILPSFPEKCKSLKLQIRGIHGEHTQSEDGVFDVSNWPKWGLSEFEAVKLMYDGVKYLIEMEKLA